MKIKKRYASKPFENNTIETGDTLINNIMEEKKRWSSVYECQNVECAFTSQVKTDCGLFVMYCMQCCMSVSADL